MGLTWLIFLCSFSLPKINLNFFYMKKLLLFITVSIFSITKLNAQCVYTCSNYAVSQITYSPLPIGTNVLALGDDDISTAIPIGFNFDFYCSTYSQVRVCSNGFITFDLTTPITLSLTPYTQMLPNVTDPNNVIAFNWNDLDPSATGSGTISYGVVGLAPNRKFIVSYTNVPIWNYLSSLNTSEIILYETTNIIEIHTGIASSNGNGLTGTEGIENATGTTGVTVSGRNAATWSTSNDAYRFSPYTTSPPSAISGNTSICTGVQSSYSVMPSPGASGYSWSVPSGWAGSSTISAITATSGASGNIQVSVIYTCGVSAPVTLSVNTIPAPFVAISSNSPIICSGNLVTITPSGATSYTLEPGTLTGSSAFLVNPDINTTYTLYGIDATGCLSVNNPFTMITVNITPTVMVNSGAVCVNQSFTMIPTGADNYSYSNGFPAITPQVAGIYNYTVIGTYTNGCSGDPAISTLTVLANPSLTLSATGNKTTICKNQSTIIMAQGADTYAWTNGPSTASYTVTPGGTTIYYVTGTNTDGGCSKTSSITIIVDECTGIAELSNTEGKLISVYPNPSNGIFNVSTLKAATVEIYDIQGKLVLKQTLAEGDHAIDMSGVIPGQYFLRATSDDASHAVILIKE